MNKIMDKLVIIDEICEGNNSNYLTEYGHIVKLCRKCMIDICNELVKRINIETMKYKKYREIQKQITNGTYPHMINDIGKLLEEIEIEITDAKYNYNRYQDLYENLKQKKLYTKCCVVCS